jgi:dTDP-4-amino-4,6-dideoxygalactose transaminase
MFYVVLPSFGYRHALISYLKGQGILSVFHYVPLHLCDMGRRVAVGKPDCPVSEDLSSRLLRLPFYNDLTEGEQAKVVQAITGFSAKKMAAGY